MTEFMLLIGNIMLLLFVVPFVTFFVISRKFEKISKEKISKFFFFGFLLVFIAISIIFYISSIWREEVGIKNPNYVRMQSFINLLFLFGNLFFFTGLLKFKEMYMKEKIKTKFILINLLIIFFILGLISGIFSLDPILNILLMVYPFSMIILSYSYVLLSISLKDYREPMWRLPSLGGLLLLLDSALYIFVVGNISDFTIFLKFRFIAFALSVTGSLLASFSSLILLRKILSKSHIVLKDGDALIERIIKQYIKEYENLIGTVSETVFKLAEKEYLKKYNKKVKSTENFEIKNLKEKELEKFFEILVDKFNDVTGSIAYGILKKIKTKENEKIINRIYKFRNK